MKGIYRGHQGIFGLDYTVGWLPSHILISLNQIQIRTHSLLTFISLRAICFLCIPEKNLQRIYQNHHTFSWVGLCQKVFVINYFSQFLTDYQGILRSHTVLCGSVHSLQRYEPLNIVCLAEVSAPKIALVVVMTMTLTFMTFYDHNKDECWHPLLVFTYVLGVCHSRNTLRVTLTLKFEQVDL